MPKKKVSCQPPEPCLVHWGHSTCSAPSTAFLPTTSSRSLTSACMLGWLGHVHVCQTCCHPKLVMRLSIELNCPFSVSEGGLPESLQEFVLAHAVARVLGTLPGSCDTGRSSEGRWTCTVEQSRSEIGYRSETAGHRPWFRN